MFEALIKIVSFQQLMMQNFNQIKVIHTLYLWIQLTYDL